MAPCVQETPSRAGRDWQSLPAFRRPLPERRTGQDLETRSFNGQLDAICSVRLSVRFGARAHNRPEIVRGQGHSRRKEQLSKSRCFSRADPPLCVWIVHFVV